MPLIRETEERPPTGPGAVITESLGAEFSKFLRRKIPPSMEKRTKETSFSGREITGRAGAIMRAHAEWSGAQSCS